MPRLDTRHMSDQSHRAYLHVLYSWMPLLMLLSVCAATISLFIVKGVGETYEVHFSYLISLSEREDVEGEFRFDGFYALQATELFTKTFASWITSPEVIVAALEHAHITTASLNTRALSKIVSSNSVAPQLVQVMVRHKSEEEAKAIAGSLQEIMDQNVDYYHDEGIPALKFRAVPTNMWTGVNRLSAPVITVATFVFTLFISINVVLLVESLKQRN